MFGPDQLSVAEASKGSCNIRVIKYDMRAFMEQCSALQGLVRK